MASIHKFPDGFLWGTATSAYQVEGGIEHNDWAEDARKGKLPKAGIACDHYNRFREDFDIARELCTNAHRFSIEWSRVEPEEGAFDEKEIAHYRDVICALIERKIEPFVTLWHWPLPLWLSQKGGFGKKNIRDYFKRYAERMAESFQNVNFWLTLNEPMLWSSHAYIKADWPPQYKSYTHYIQTLRNLIACHMLAYKAIHDRIPSARVGIAKNNIYFEGCVSPFARWWWNRWFLKKIRHSQDFIGLNYYFHKRIRGLKEDQNKNKLTSDMGWEIYPEGIYHVLKELQRYRKPIYITENGIADTADAMREHFIKNHLAWVHRAIEEGIDVRGYFYWSLLDNFEWAHGFGPRFGLVEIDYATQARKIRNSAYIYRDIAKTNILSI